MKEKKKVWAIRFLHACPGLAHFTTYLLYATNGRWISGLVTPHCPYIQEKERLQSSVWTPTTSTSFRKLTFILYKCHCLCSMGFCCCFVLKEWCIFKWIFVLNKLEQWLPPSLTVRDVPKHPNSLPQRWWLHRGKWSLGSQSSFTALLSSVCKWWKSLGLLELLRAADRKVLRINNLSWSLKQKSLLKCQLCDFN